MARSLSGSSDDEAGAGATGKENGARGNTRKATKSRFVPNKRVGAGGDSDVEMDPTQYIPDTQNPNGIGVQEDEGYDTAGSDNDESPSARKRLRVNEDGDDAIVKPERRVIAPLERDDDGFVAGSIVRVRLHNFITYDDAEFRLGPSLNMIIGPNGSGKSSIAAAIAIGCGFSPNIIKENSDLGQYVKLGCKDGFTEIELKGRRGEPNLVIRRCLNPGSKKSTYTLNGQTATQKAVAEKVHSLDVNLDNLCCFLPQERVGKFAALNPQQLLRKTQETAGHPKLLKWHDILIEEGKELKELEEVIKSKEVDLQTKKVKAQDLETDVAQLKEKERLQKEVIRADLYYNVALLGEAVVELKKKKGVVRTQKRKVAKLRASRKPMEDFLNELEAKVEYHNDRKQRTKAVVTKHATKIQDGPTEADKLNKKSEKLVEELRQKKKVEKNRKEKAKKLRVEVDDLEKKLDALKSKEIPDPEPLKKQREGMGPKVSELRKKVNANDAKLRAFDSQRKDLDEQIANVKSGLDKLKDRASQREQALKTTDRDIMDVVTWLRNNQQLFKMEISEPPMLHVNVKNPQDTTAVEACFRALQLKTFVCHCEEDDKLFNEYVNDTTRALGRRVRVPVWFRPASGLAPAPFNEQQMRHYGFDGYVIDRITYPKGLEWYFKKELGLHRIPIGAHKLKVPSDVIATDIVAEPNPPNTCFVAENTMYRVNKSQYGRRLAQTQTYNCSPPNKLNTSQGPTEQIQRLEAELRDLEQQAEAVGGEEEVQLRRESAETKEKLKDLKIEHDKLSAEIKKISNALTERGSTELAIKNKRKELAEAQAPPNDKFFKDCEQLRSRIDAVTIERVDLAEAILAEGRAMTDALVQYTRAELKLGHAVADRDAMKEILANESQDLKVESEYLERLEAEKKAANQHRKEVQAQASEALADAGRDNPDLNEEIRIFWDACNDLELPCDTPRDSQHHLGERARLKGELDVIHVGNEDAINTYENLMEEINRLELNMETLKETRQGREDRMQKVKGKWVPALYALRDSVNSKFSAAFDRCGCDGEVNIEPDPDFAQWSLGIHVSFRDDEPLQRLSAQRQSGGERSLTTMLYLMSLTEVARSPFCLVDEINQGMDARAEREVHNQLVGVSCTPESGQYFLITPKLLSNLRYDPRMKILCVNNGEWMNLVEDGNVKNGNLLHILKNIERSK